MFRLLKKLRNAYCRIRDKFFKTTDWFFVIWRHKYKINIGIKPKWSLREKIKYNRLGFTDEDYFLYNLKENDYHNYICHWERLRLEDINGRFADILGEKLIFERIFGNFIGVPHINCWVQDGKCVDLDAGKEVDILSVLSQKRELIAKPTRSVGGGTGVHKLELKGDEYLIDGKTVSPEQLKSDISKCEEYIISDSIKQADYANAVFPESVNSMRITTVRRKSGEFEIVMAFHRFGTEMSKPVDNCSSDGVFCAVDMQTGKLSAAVRETEPGKIYSLHPDNNSKIEGVIIPDWEKIKQRVLHAHRCFPYYTFLAWDIVLSDSGEVYALEANRGTDMPWQIITPFRNEKLGEFMRENGLLDEW